ncbi:MAG: hypothetical protein ABII90_11160 [Bacteroidota bacterium]
MKTKKSILISIISIIILIHPFSNLSAQNHSEDAVYLKNGSIIRGEILEDKTGEYVKIETINKNIWVFKSDEIERITKEKVPLITKEQNNKNGYYNITDNGILGGKDLYQNKYSFSFLTINGYKFNERLSLGLGVGIEYMDIVQAPVFLDVRFNFFKSKFTPFIAMQGGYSLPLENNYDDWGPKYKGGYLLNPCIGVRNYFNNNSAIVFSVGFRHQQLKSTRKDYSWGDDGIIERTNLYNRISVRVGFLFN